MSEIEQTITGRTHLNNELVDRMDYTRESKTNTVLVSFSYEGKQVALGRFSLDRGDDDLLNAVGPRNAARVILSSRERDNLSGSDLTYHAGIAFPADEILSIKERNPVDHHLAAVQEEAAKRGTRGTGVESSAGGEATNRIESTAPAATQPAIENPDVDESTNRARLMEIERAVRAQFRIDGNLYHFKDKNGALAFKDNGNSLIAGSNDERAAKAMAALAESRAWTSLRVSGHPDFKRAVWREASSRGLQVSGYRPTQQEIEQQSERSQRAEQVERNTVEKSDARMAESDGKTRSRTHEGTLIEHGPAPYKRDSTNNPSYVVKLQTEEGSVEVWGKDLGRAVKESQAQAGDQVTLVQAGSKPVTVRDQIRDLDGKVIREVSKSALLNAWQVNVQTSDRSRVVTAVADKYIDHAFSDSDMRNMVRSGVQSKLALREREGTVPAVPIYDNRTPAQERTPERSREAEKQQDLSR